MALVDGAEYILVEMERAPSNASATSAAASSAAMSSATASTSASISSSEPFVIDLGELTGNFSTSKSLIQLTCDRIYIIFGDP
jgi:hypothetical protein